MTKKIPFRKDIVGSFLRPQALKDARAAFEEGRISARELKAVEDREIRILVEKEKANGLRDFTDGRVPPLLLASGFPGSFDGL